ncbi:MAG: MurR/RpiR family transcriptional regulator [Treponema sp.]|jgi:DNA-binding MurR/RpiR family transcriptional regulator|nr:MurR/RpiR family transcriptional regulator [Treponema sp.]
MEYPANLIDYLRANSGSFQKSDLLIARFITEQGGQVLKMTVTEFAEKIGVSDATIIRFCQKIGFKGYYQAKIVLAQSLRENAAGGGEGESPAQDHRHDPVSHVSDVVLKNIRETEKNLDPAVIDAAASLINQAARVCFYAVGNSYPIALDAAYKLSRAGIPTFASDMAEYQISNAHLLDSASVAFGISHSGGSRTVLKAFEIAKTRGAPVILLSNHEKSPLAKLADITLITRAYGEYFLDAGLITRICGMYLVDILFFAVLIKKNGNYAKLFHEEEKDMADFTL